MGRKRKPKRAGNGEGSFTYTDSGKVQYRFTYKDIYGKSRRKCFTGIDEIDCMEKVRAFEADLEKILSGVDVNATIPEIIEDRYRKDLEMNLIGEQGYCRNIGTLNIIKRSGLGSMPIREVTKPHITLYLSSITHYSNSVISKSFQQLRLAFDIACDKDIIIKNIMRSKDIKCPKSDKADKKVSGYTSEEQTRLIEAIKNHKVPFGRNSYKHQLLIELYTGMRMGEINALRCEDIDFNKKLIHVSRTVSRGMDYRNFIKDGTKTYAGRRTIPMNKKAEEVLKAAVSEMKRNPEKLIFYDYNKKSIVETSQVNSFFKRVCEKAEVPFNGQHALRHTFATRCIESGVQPVVLKKWMGHTDIHVTLDTYADVFDRMNDDAVEKLDRYMESM